MNRIRRTRTVRGTVGDPPRLQDTLRTNQIEAEIPEIVHAMLESLSARPSLCRGLIAAYLLEA